MSNAAFIFVIAVICFVLGWTTVAVLLGIAAFTIAVLCALGVVAELIFGPLPPRR